MTTSQKDWRHLRMMLWKSSKSLIRAKKQLIIGIVLPLIFVSLAIILKAVIPVDNYPSDNHLDEWQTIVDTSKSDVTFADSGRKTNIYFFQDTYTPIKYIGLVKNSAIPQSDVILADIMATIQQKLPKSNTQGIYFDSTDKLNEYVRGTEYTKEIVLAVEIQTYDPVNNEYKFALRQNTQNQDSNSDQAYQTEAYTGLNTFFQSQSMQGALLGTMSAVTDSLIRSEYKVLDTSFNLFYATLKTPNFSIDISSQINEQLLPVIFLISYLVPMIVIAYQIAEEKEKKLKAMMKMVGLRESIYILSWFIIYFAITTFVSVLIFIAISFNVLDNCAPGYVFVLLLLYGISQFGLMLIAVALCDTIRATTLLISLFSILTYFIQAIVNQSQTGAAANIIVSLFPNSAMGLGVKMMLYLQGTQEGLNFDTITRTKDNYSFGLSLLMMFCDAILYTIIGLYLQAILATDYGQKEKFYFCLTKEFWTRGKRRREKLARLQQVKAHDDLEKVTDHSEILQLEEREDVDKGIAEDPVLGEITDQDLEQTLRITKLKKVFDKTKVAVDEITVSMFKGQIFALLGHNGAGKTTTIQMLTGLIKHDSGSAKAFGFDVFNELSSIQEIMGICPQHDVLFEKLSIEEHLILYANLKNVPPNKVMIYVNNLIEDLGLQKKRTSLAGELSGGQKRRLSLAIALVGDSKLVLLDEPTSGMDPTARREMWDILKKYKENRIIILTTHYMDEADVLGDRIAIMSHGKIQCCGSSLFLKNKFGVGYLLEIQPINRSQNLNSLKNLLALYAPNQDIKITNDEAGNTVFQLPKESSENFKHLFEELDSKLEDLNIQNYTLRVTTLEEVFIKIGEQAEQEHISQKISQINRVNDSNMNQTQQEEPLMQSNLSSQPPNSRVDQALIQVSMLAQIKAIFCRRRLIQRREKKLLILELIFPLVYLGMGFGISSINFISDGVSRNLMDSNLFPEPQLIVYNQIQAVTPSSTITPKDFLQGKNSYFLDPSQFTFSDSGVISEKSGFTNVLTQFDQSLYQNTPKPVYGTFLLYTLQEKFIETVIFTNETSQTAKSVYANYLLTNILRQFTSKPNAKISFQNDPLPLSIKQKSGAAVGQGISVTVFIAFAFQMVCSAMVQIIVKEKETKVKQQLYMSGCSVTAYWIGNYLQELATHSIILVVCYIYTLVFKIDIPYVWVIFILFAISNPPFLYFWTQLFDKESPAGSSTRVVFIFLGAFFSLMAAIFQFIDQVRAVGLIFTYLFSLFPIFAFTYGILMISYRPLAASIQGIPEASPFDWNCAGSTIPYFLFSFVFYSAMTILIDKGKIRCKNSAPPKVEAEDFGESLDQDTDVLAEASRVDVAGVEKDSQIQVRHLRKTYITDKEQKGDDDQTEEKEMKDQTEREQAAANKKSKKKKNFTYRAVRDISFGVDKNECFVLLGVNGAGKTTTFKCLIGEIPETEGQIHLTGHPIGALRKNIDQMKSLIGYCPQYDPITPQLTVREHMILIGTLKGIPQERLEALATQLEKDFTIEEFKDVQSQKLSGGNKRKLCAAMALIGRPPIAFLDEQSAGVDPASRRKMWKVVKDYSVGSAMIVTTHSMEEAEALGTKMGIMVEGKFKCFGTAKHLKEKFGKGFEIQLKINIDRVGDVQSKLNNDQENDMEKDQENQKTCDVKVIVEMLRSMQVGDFDISLEKEFSEVGAFKNFHFKVHNEVPIDLGNLMKSAQMFKELLKIKLHLENSFKEVTVLDQSQNYANFRVSKDGHSIGYMFGFIEELSKTFAVKEYSVQQTTLEQIFNSFAKESKVVKGQYFKKSTTTVAKPPSVAKIQEEFNQEEEFKDDGRH